jgi:superfamily II DNA/RNA helicase
MSTNFAQFGLAAPLVGALTDSNITEPFPIQRQAIPPAMTGRDIQGKAPTGSGKTLAFGLPTLHRVGRAGGSRPRALILAPTRELASQIETSLRPLSKAADRRVFAVYGGVGYGPQKAALRKGVDVLVATPGRLEDLIDQRCLDLSDVDIVVVDEADRMADMGFLPAVRRILAGTSPDRQTMLFSATLDGDIAVLSRDFQSDPVRVEAADVESTMPDAAHHFWRVSREDRVEHAAEVIRTTGKSIVFTRTRHGADRLAKQLGRVGVDAVAMHGGRSQGQRERALRAFSAGTAQALIATDVAARGIHVDDVATVIHFDVASDPKDYQHRSGRTARAGATGTVVTFVMSDQEREVRRMQRELEMEVTIEHPTAGQFDRLSRRPGKPTETEARHRPAPDRPANATYSLYVGNLPWSTKVAELEALFGEHGVVEKVTLVTDRRTGRSKGYGFVVMAGASPAAMAERLHGSTLGGRTLKVRPAT